MQAVLTIAVVVVAFLVGYRTGFGHGHEYGHHCERREAAIRLVERRRAAAARAQKEGKDR